MERASFTVTVVDALHDEPLSYDLTDPRVRRGYDAEIDDAGVVAIRFKAPYEHIRLRSGDEITSDTALEVLMAVQHFKMRTFF